MGYQLSLFNRISQLPWWKEDFYKFLEEYTWPNIEPRLNLYHTNTALQDRIKDFPVNQELVEDFLYFHVEELIQHKGYMLCRRRKLNFVMFMNFEDSKSEQELGIIHEANHFICRNLGTGTMPHQNADGSLTEILAMEESIENEAKRFVGYNEGIALDLINKYFI